MDYHLQITGDRAQIQQPGYVTNRYTLDEIKAVIKNTTHQPRLRALQAAQRLLELQQPQRSLPAFLTKRKEFYKPE